MRKYAFKRTIKFKIVRYQLLDKIEGVVKENTVRLVTKVTDDAALLTAIRRQSDDAHVPFKILDVQTESGYYGITMEEFLEHAEQLPTEMVEVID